MKERFYGCGNPIPLDLLGAAPGAHVLDLGSGSGRDCYVAAAFVSVCVLVLLL